jgi:hypothetical protein
MTAVGVVPVDVLRDVLACGADGSVRFFVFEAFSRLVPG